MCPEQREREGTTGHHHTPGPRPSRCSSWLVPRAPEEPAPLHAASRSQPAHEACTEAAATQDHVLYSEPQGDCMGKTGETWDPSRNCTNSPGWRGLGARGLGLPHLREAAGASVRVLWPTCRSAKSMGRNKGSQQDQQGIATRTCPPHLAPPWLGRPASEAPTGPPPVYTRARGHSSQTDESASL